MWIERRGIPGAAQGLPPPQLKNHPGAAPLKPDAPCGTIVCANDSSDRVAIDVSRAIKTYGVMLKHRTGSWIMRA